MDEDYLVIILLHWVMYSMLFFGILYKGLVVDDIQQMLAGRW